jgi:hypothetical protein
MWWIAVMYGSQLSKEMNTFNIINHWLSSEFGILDG